MYGEPWFIETGTNPPQGPEVEWWVSVRNADRGLVIYDAWMAREGEKHPAELAQWERVVAAVNACRDMDDDLVRDIDPPKLTAFVKAVGTLNPAGIHFLVSEVERVVAVMRANLPTLETALRGVKG